MVFHSAEQASSGGNALGLVLFDGATPISSNVENERLLVMAAKSCVNDPTLSASFHAQSLYYFERKVLSAYHHLHYCVNNR